jgi:Ribbon-helix-helix protein, copG family
MPANRHSSPTTNAKTTGEQELVRLSVNLNKETADALKEMAKEHGISFTEAVRRAISVYKFIDDEVHEGRKVHTLDADNKNVRELVLM